MPLLLFTVPILSTLIGGLLAVRFRRHVSLLIAVGAGLLLGAAFLDLLPEAVDLGRQAALPSADVLGLTLASFLLFYAIESGLDRWGGHGQTPELRERMVGRTGALMLIFHSFRDGLAIGAAYAASHPAGYAVALGIAAHDVGDGMNTVLLTTGGKKPLFSDYAFLAADALAPFFGGLLTAWWVLSPRASVVLLVLAAGLFLQMATGDFLPELRRVKEHRAYLLPCVLLGTLIVYLANFAIASHR